MKKFWRGDFNWNATLPLVLLLISVGCTKTMVNGTYTQKPEKPADIVENTAGLIGSQNNISSQLRAAEQYIPLVKSYAQKYEIDWILVLAMMKQESLFDLEAVSHRGAYGLMQLMPLTQIEIAERLSLQETISPRNNILAGIYYFKSLYSNVQGVTEDDRLRIALAAYNAGLSRIYDAQTIARYLGENPLEWNSVAKALTLLTKQNFTLHQRIWEAGKPPSGYFRDWKQTHNYVNEIITRYNTYSLTLR